MRSLGRWRWRWPGRERELLGDNLQLGDEFLDVSELAVVADVAGFLAIGCGRHAVAGFHGDTLLPFNDTCDKTGYPRYLQLTVK
jgi:hypothetical protein